MHAESEDEIIDISIKPNEIETRRPDPKVDADQTDDSDVEVAPQTIDDDSDREDDRYNEKSDYKPSKNAILSSGSDTEDEIDRVVRRNAEANNPPKPATQDDDDVYDKTTDDETQQRPPPSQSSPPKRMNNNNRSVTPLPEFFKGKVFYLSANVSSVDTIKLTRFIGVYCGELTTNAAEANYIVSNKAKQLPADFAGEVVKPLWVFECNDLECLLPTQRYRFD